MIKNFKSKLARDVFDGEVSARSRKLPVHLHSKAQRLMDQLNVATRLATLSLPPGNMLEALRGNLKDFYSIRINSQWRIIFKWEDGNAFEVDILGSYL